MQCSQTTLTRRDTHRITARPLLCKCWKCVRCAPMLKRKVIRRAIVGKPTTMLTITINPKAHPDPDEAARQLKTALVVLMRRLRRRYKGDDLQYMAVFEKTQAGHPHLHVLLRAPYIPQRYISHFMSERLDSPIIDIRATRNSRAVARYIGKYLGKDPTKFSGCQRYWCSRAWRTDHDEQREQKEERKFWHHLERRIDLVADNLTANGWIIQWDTHPDFRDSFIADPPPVHQAQYPRFQYLKPRQTAWIE